MHAPALRNPAQSSRLGIRRQRKGSRRLWRGTHMKRRQLLTALAGAGTLAGASRRRTALSSVLVDCGCASQIVTATGKPPGAAAFRDVGSKLRITNMQVFVTLDERIAQADRPYFRQTRDESGSRGMGGGHAGRQGCGCHGLCPGSQGSAHRQRSHTSEHLYQLMYLGSFYRGGPVL